MKIKRFNESLNEGEPEVGDYVIAYNYFYEKNSIYDIYINNNIGKFISISDDGQYLVEYQNFPGWKGSESIQRRYVKIKYWSKDKKDLETILNTDKFNI